MAAADATKRNEEESVWSGRKALDHLFVEYVRAKAEAQEAERRVQRFAETIRLVIDGAPATERQQLSKRFGEVGEPLQSSRVNDVSSNVVSIFRHSPRREFSVPELVEEATKIGLEVDAKSIANAVAYLAKTGKLAKVSRGQYRYIDLGIGLEYDQDRDDPTERLTEH